MPAAGRGRVTAPLMKAASFLTAAALINLLVLICSLAVVTAFPAATAGYASMKALLKDGDNRIIAVFARSLREQLLRRMILGVLLGVFLTVVLSNVLFLQHQATPLALPLYTTNLGLAVVWVTTAAAAIRRAATSSTGSIRRLLSGSLQDACRFSLANFAIVMSFAVCALLTAFSPITGVIYGLCLPLTAIVLTASRFPSSNSPGDSHA